MTSVPPPTPTILSFIYSSLCIPVFSDMEEINRYFSCMGGDVVLHRMYDFEYCRDFGLNLLINPSSKSIMVEVDDFTDKKRIAFFHMS